MDDLTSTTGIVALAAAALALVALIAVLVLMRSLRRMRADQRAILGGSTPQFGGGLVDGGQRRIAAQRP